MRTLVSLIGLLVNVNDVKNERLGREMSLKHEFGVLFVLTFRV